MRVLYFIGISLHLSPFLYASIFISSEKGMPSEVSVRCFSIFFLNTHMPLWESFSFALNKSCVVRVRMWLPIRWSVRTDFLSRCLNLFVVMKSRFSLFRVSRRSGMAVIGYV